MPPSSMVQKPRVGCKGSCHRVTVRRATTRTNKCLCPYKELSGPRSLRRVMKIVSKPRIWDRGAEAVSLETQRPLQMTGDYKQESPICRLRRTWPISHVAYVVQTH